MAFGINFGKNKTTTTQNTAVDQTTTQNQQQAQTTNQQQSSATTSNTATTGTTATSGATKNTGTTAQQTSGIQEQVNTSRSFSDPVIAALESMVLGQLGSSGSTGGPRAESLSGFDAEGFVSGGLAAAESRQRMDLESSINGLFDAIGGGAGDNTMAALMANRLRGDAAANLAGIESQLVGQANQIQRENVGAAISERATDNAFVNQLLANLKGGVATTEGAVTSQQATTGQQQTIGEEQQRQQQAQQSSTESTTNQILASVINSLLSGTTNVTGTESVVGTQKKSGGGFGLSI